MIANSSQHSFSETTRRAPPPGISADKFSSTILSALLAILLLTALNAYPASLHLSADDRFVEIAPFLQLHEDPGRIMQVGDMAEQNVQFTPVGMEGALNLGYSYSAWWLRLDIEAEKAGPWYLEVGYPSLDSVELFLPDAGDGYLHMQAGDLLPFSKRLLPHHNLVFPVKLPAGESRLYLRITSAGNLTIPAAIWEPQTFHLHNQTNYAALAIYYGMLLALGLYNLILYFNLRDRAYLFYVLFLASMAVGNASMDGLAGQFIWPGWATWAHHALPIGMAASGLLAACFVRSFLNTRHNRPRIDRALQFFIAWFAGSILLNLVSYQWAEMMTSLGGMAFSFTTLLFGVISYRQKYPGARYFLLAWISLLTGSIMLAMRNFGWLPTNFATTHGFQVGSAIEMLLLSFALADRIHTLRKEKEFADAKLLQMQEENLTVLRQSEQALERRVAERTQELTEANARLESLSRQDPLTGLGNRHELEDAWNKMASHAKRSSRSIATLLMDLNNFKPINDTHGHNVGDHVLREVATRLRKVVRASDTVVRLGGDEFVMLVDGITVTDEVEPIKKKIEEVIGESIQVNGLAVIVGVSIGFGIYPADGTTLPELLQRADVTMYRNKRQIAAR